MSMTIEQAIKRIEVHMEVHRIGQYPHYHIGKALTMAIDALREKAEREDPKPLTIEELRHGEPVYVVVPGKPHRDKWCIVDLCSPSPGLHGLEYFCHLYIVATPAVKVYRHKPKEGQR